MLAWAGITECSTLGGLHNINVLPHSSGGRKSEISHGQDLMRASFLADTRPPSHCVLSDGRELSGVSSSLSKATSPVGLEPRPYDLILP